MDFKKEESLTYQTTSLYDLKQQKIWIENQSVNLVRKYNRAKIMKICGGLMASIESFFCLALWNGLNSAWEDISIILLSLCLTGVSYLYGKHLNDEIVNLGNYGDYLNDCLSYGKTEDYKQEPLGAPVYVKKLSI